MCKYLGKAKDFIIRCDHDHIFVDFSWGFLNLILMKGSVLRVGLSSYKVRHLNYIKMVKKMVQGNISSSKVGYYSEMTLEGLGYMFMLYAQDKKLRFEGGYSHGLYLSYGKGVLLAVEKKRLLIYGLLQKEVSDLNKSIRSLKRLDRYKGKGVRNKDEAVLLKIGKKR
jgi:large subunit ribosomal protein L6